LKSRECDNFTDVFSFYSIYISEYYILIQIHLFSLLSIFFPRLSFCSIYISETYILVLIPILFYSYSCLILFPLLPATVLLKYINIWIIYTYPNSFFLCCRSSLICFLFLQSHNLPAFHSSSRSPLPATIYFSSLISIFLSRLSFCSIYISETYILVLIPILYYSSSCLILFLFSVPSSSLILFYFFFFSIFFSHPLSHFLFPFIPALVRL
jgi:hypothetical protein